MLRIWRHWSVFQSRWILLKHLVMELFALSRCIIVEKKNVKICASWYMNFSFGLQYSECKATIWYTWKRRMIDGRFIYINKPFSVDCSDFFSDDTGNRQNCSCSSFRIHSSRCFYGAIYIFNIIKFHARLKRTTREILKINLMIFSNRISA